MAEPLPLGLVLAGGRSSRFGGEKAMVAVDGRPMIARVIKRLHAGCAEIAVNARAGSPAAAFAADQRLTLLSDSPGYPAGPLAGVAAGLRWARRRGAEALVTAPCDTPFLPHDLVARLRSAPPERVVMAATAHGAQPLCALWRVEVLAPLEALLVQGRHGRVDAFVASQGGGTVLFDDARAFANINTRADLMGERGAG